MSTAHATTYQTLSVSLHQQVACVRLNRPEKANALNLTLWQELRQAFQWIDATPEVRVAVLQAQGPVFCGGIDLHMLMQLRQQVSDPCEGRSREQLRRLILDLQDILSSLERCRKPVLAAIHGACIGAGVDLICCADMRYCASDASFCVKEIDLGMTADVGTLQRLPRLIGDGMARELAYTARTIDAPEALRLGLVNQVFDSAQDLHQAVHELAAQIAAKSPLAVRGTKEALAYARDHSVTDSLNQIATWNAAMLMSEDLQEAIRARTERRAPRFRD